MTAIDGRGVPGVASPPGPARAAGVRAADGVQPEMELDLVVIAKTRVAERVVMLDLRDPAGAALPDWAPGAHIDLLLGPGLVRQYSLCGDAADPAAWRIAVLREAGGRGGSALVHDVLARGEVVRARGPRNHFPLVPARRYLFIAGGIGITPILPMLAAADAAGADWALVYGGRTGAAMAFAEELAVRHGDRVQVRPQDETGLIDLDSLLGTPAAGTLVYCCGPESLLTAVEERCAAWPPGTLHVERFAPRGDGGGERAAFEVEVASTGRVLTVPADASILSVLEDAGVPVLSSCAEGTCGTCETGVIGGIPDHRDSVLAPAEQAAGDVMMICVSRSRTPRLVLDL